MTILEQLRADIKAALEQRAVEQKSIDDLLDKVQAEERSDLTPDETTLFTELRLKITEGDEKRAVLVERELELVALEEARAAAIAAEARIAALPRNPEIRVGAEPQTYMRENRSVSYLRDLVTSRSEAGSDPEAIARLQRYAQEVEVEARANPNRTDGTGGYFVPPAWLMSDYVALARAGRVTADLCKKMPLPAGTDSINIPKVATGGTVAAQTADGAAASKTDITDTAVTAGVKTIAGQQVFSLQLMEQSPVGFDEVVFGDLFSDYASKLDAQVLNGSGSNGQVTGILNTSSIVAVTYTDASPSLPELYPKAADAIQQINSNRYLAPNAWIMHPRRWGWMLAALDSSSRPFVVPNAAGPYMAQGVSTDVAAEGSVGSFQGLPVYLDANVPTTLGGGTEDIILAGRFSDAYLWEGDLRTRVLFETDANTLEVRLQVYAYVAFTAARYPKAFGTVGGTGAAAPTF